MTNKAIISKAEKGNSIIITYQDDYHKKVIDFISNNNFTITKNDPLRNFRENLEAITMNAK